MKKRVISLLLALALCLTILPAMALADDGSASVGAVAKIGANTYASLAAAVKAAVAGAKIELTNDDASEQKITIDKNLSIELNGHNLPSTCFTITHGTVSIRNSAADGGEINKDSEIVANKVSDSVSTSYSLINDIRATISVFGDAQVTLHNLNVGRSGAVSETNPKLKPVYIGGSGAKLTINGGRYVGTKYFNTKVEGTDGIFFYNGGDSELTINAGYFEANCGLSVYPKPDISKLHIVGGRFVGNASALWIDGNTNGNKAVTTKETAERFIDKSISQIVIDGAFNSKDITISSKLFLADGSTGSTKQDEPDQITLSGESVTLAPEILGGTGERTYEWKKVGSESVVGTEAALEATEAGSYTLTITADGNDTLTVYYTVTASEHAHPICGEECAHHGAHSEEISDWVGVASLSEITKAGHYYLTENVDLSERWVVVNNVVLCLNGKNITEKNGNEEVFYIGSNKSFAITDCHTGEDMGKLTHKSDAVGRCVVVAEKGSFTLYGGNITGSRSSYSGVGVDNSGSFTMYGGAITKNETTDNAAHGAGVHNSGTFTMCGGEISGNITQGCGGGVYNSGTLVVSGDVRITGNTKSGNSTKNNVYLEWNKVITIGENGLGENAKIGVTLRDWPAAGTTTEVANSATDGAQEHIISDNDRYEVSYDDGKLVVGVKVEKHEHFLCTTGESCTGVGGHEETGKVTFVKWTDELVKAQYNNSETRTAKNSLPKEAGYYYLDDDVTLNFSWDAADGVVLCLNGHSVTQENSERFLFEVGSYGKSVAITVTDCQDTGAIKYADGRDIKESDTGVIVGQNGTFNLYGGTIQSCSVGVKIYKDGDKQGTFNMYGGKITGNAYGGVKIEKGMFNMYAGEITENTFLNSSYTFGNDPLEGYAGGVYNSDGTFNMYGGSITNNTASGNTGGGVCVFGSVTTISGNATITGNKIYIDEDTLIDCNVRTASPIAEITDGFTGSIGVTAYVWPEAGVEREVVSKANSATGVTSDRDDYEVLCKDGKLYVVKKDSQTEKKEQTDLTLKNIPSTGAELPYGEELDFVIEGGDGTGNVSWEVVNGEDGGKARIENGKLIPENTGTVTIKVRKEGDDTFKPTEITVAITIVKGKLTGAPSYTPITADGKTLADAALEPNASWPAGTLTWVDAEGNVLDETTVVEANTTYKWKFTPDNENYESLTGSYTLYEKSGGDDDGPHKPSYPVINPTTPSTSGGQTTTEPESPFRDVKKSDYSYKAIAWAAENGIAGGIGNGLFDPNGPCTRAQIVTFLWRAAGSPAPKALSGFVDVPADAYYAKAVAWAVENGITKGTSATTFSPDDICTRAQAVTFLFRAFKAKANGVSTVFRDVAPTAYYAGAVKWAVDNEVTDGIGNGLFGPDNACTRAQIVTFLWRLYAD